MGALADMWEWILRGSLNSPDFLGPVIFPGQATYAPPVARYLGFGLALAAVLFALWQRMDRPDILAGIVLAAAGIRAAGSAFAAFGPRGYADPTSLGTIIAGPVAGIYLWSVLIYAMLRMMRRGRSRSVGSPLMRLSWNPATAVLTALLVVAVPAGLLWAEARGIELSGSLWALAAEWNPPVYTLLAMAYGTFYRRTGDARLRYLAWILGLSALGGWSHWLARLPFLEGAIPRVWPSGLVLLALLQAFLWFPAAGAPRGRRP